MTEIKKSTTIEAWKAALKYILEKGKDFEDKDERVCREILNLMLVIEDPSRDYQRPIEIMNGFEKWVYPSLDEIKQIMLTKEPSATYGSTILGPRIFNYKNTLNQIDDFIIPLLKSDSTSRRAIVSVYDPIMDSKITMKQVISVTNIYFKIKDGKLNLTFFIRSCDYFIGWPVGLFQMHTIQKYVAEKLGILTGSITTISTSAHIFEDNLETIKEVISNEQKRTE